MRLLGALAAASTIRHLVFAMAFFTTPLVFDQVAWLWLAARWVAGLLAPIVLTWMAWQSARIRSTQSATGILYVVVIFVFFGELTDMILQEHLATLGRTRG
jgi:hypothetical protein